MFKGINFIQPVFEVVSPKIGISYKVRPLSNGEDIALKNSVLYRDSAIQQELNNIIYEVVVNKEDYFKSKDEFFSEVPESDRNLILYGLYMSTYENVREIEMRCSKCGNVENSKLDFKDLLVVDKEYKPSDENNVKFLDREFVIEDSKIMSNAKIIIRDISIKRVQDILKLTQSTKFENSTDIYLPYVYRLEVYDDKGELEDKTEDITDIIIEYKKFPIKIKNKIIDIIEKEFKPYEPQFYADWECGKCGNTEKFYYDIAQEFFRMALGL